MAVEIYPKSLSQEGKQKLVIDWEDGTQSKLSVRKLRLSCSCAECVDEWTREPRLDPTKVPLDIQPVQIDSVGRYALQIVWSDGHQNGIYPFETLKEMGEVWDKQNPS